MALKWIDGFEQYGDINRLLEGVGGGAAWSQVDQGDSSDTDGGWELRSDNPATQSWHLRMWDGSPGSKAIRRIFGAESQVVGLGYRFQVDDLPSQEGSADNSNALILADIRDVSNASHFVIVMGTDGSVFALRGADIGNSDLGGTLLGRSQPCIAAGGYHHFEMKAKIANSGGYIEIRINEVTVLNLTGIDTQSTANATAAQFIVCRSGGVLTVGGAGFTSMDLDDVFCWDDDASDADNTIVDWVGDKGCYYLKPNADTAESDWVRSAGATNYSLLDEVPPSGTDYISDDTGAARTIVQVEALPGNVVAVLAMVPVIYARKEESGSVTVRGGIVVGASESYSPANSPSTSYAYMEPGPKTVDPDTGVAWATSANPDLLIERTV